MEIIINVGNRIKSFLRICIAIRITNRIRISITKSWRTSIRANIRRKIRTRIRTRPRISLSTIRIRRKINKRIRTSFIVQSGSEEKLVNVFERVLYFNQDHKKY